MKKSKQKSLEERLVLRIDDKISIHADSFQYIMIINNHPSYFDSLERCFQEIFNYKVKIALIDNPEKNIQKIIEIHKEIKKWLKDMFGKIETPRF